MICGCPFCEIHRMLDSVSTADKIQILLLIVAIVSIWVGVRAHNNQLRLTFYADYTKRYQEIILNFPENINTPDFNLGSFNDQDRRDKTMRYLRVYFDLCSEEFHLWGEIRGIDKKIWENWKKGIENALSKPAFQQAWVIIKEDTVHSDDFREWVDKIIEAKKVSDGN